MTFRFRKLYADAVSDDGTVSIIYLAWLAVYGVRFSTAAVERYTPGGRREVRRGRPVRWEFDPDAVGSDWRIQVEFPDGALELHYHRALPPWRPTDPAPSEAMEWRVLIPRATVTGCWIERSAREMFTGLGYCDWVELRRPPRLLGMRRLHWGRVHTPSEAVVFTKLEFTSGHTWSHASQWDGGGTRSDGAPPFSLQPIRLLHDGPGLDRMRFPMSLERIFARALTGPLHEQRWLASVTCAGNSEPGVAIHEVVDWGASGDTRGRRM